MKQCKIENCENPVWGKCVCKYHTKSSTLKPKLSPQRHQKEKEVQTINPMWEFFLGIWKKRNHVSEISGEKLFSPPTSLYFHHIIPKQELKRRKLFDEIYDEEGIILLTPEEHQQVHSDMYFNKEINRRRELLKIKYNIL